MNDCCQSEITQKSFRFAISEFISVVENNQFLSFIIIFTVLTVVYMSYACKYVKQKNE